jgi:hypothetical protein
VCKRENKERKREIAAKCVRGKRKKGREREREREEEEKHNTHIIDTHTQTHVKRRESIVIMPNLCSNVSRYEEKECQKLSPIPHRKLLAITLYLVVLCSSSSSSPPSKCKIPTIIIV